MSCGQFPLHYSTIVKLLSLSCIIVVLELCIAERKWQVDINKEEYKKVGQKVCLLKPERGPCRAKLKMYYYNARKRSCRPFDWGGCQGNGNRFISNSNCTSRCVDVSNTDEFSRPAICRLTFSYGDCYSSMERYAFNARTAQCEKRTWSGCGGNPNRFDTMGECMKNCSNLYSAKGDEGITVVSDTGITGGLFTYSDSD